jgi:hypothetical protein
MKLKADEDYQIAMEDGHAGGEEREEESKEDRDITS